MSHFSRAFRRTMGVAPHHWLLTRRVEVAKEKLRNTRLPLPEVALVGGFADQSHLTRVFTRTVGGWLGLGKFVWRKLQVSYDLPKPSSAPPRHALSCAACRDDCTMLRSNQVQSANSGVRFAVVGSRGRAPNDAATRSGGASP